MQDVNDIVGRQFGKLTVLKFDHQESHKLFYKCKCLCGNTCVEIRGNLTGSRVTNCGCLKYDRSKRKKKEQFDFDIDKGLYLRDVMRMSIKQIAEEMKVSELCVRRHLLIDPTDDTDCAEYTTRIYLKRKNVQNKWNTICAELRKNLPHKEDKKHGNTV